MYTLYFFSVSTSDYTAKKLTDYRPLKKLPVNFQSGQKLKKVVIDIINDKKVENPERFFAVLSPGSPSVQIVPAGKKANIRIDDDDCKYDRVLLVANRGFVVIHDRLVVVCS